MSSRIPAASGIYRITCTVTGKIYIGSTRNLRKRHIQHFTDLRQNGHYNPYLQRAWNKHGEQAFTFEVIELVLPMSLTTREQYWFEKLKPYNPRRGFNIARTAHAFRLGMKNSLEHRKRLSVAQTGKKQSEETKRKLAEVGRSRTHSTQTRKKMSLVQRGHPVSQGQREQLRASHLGKKASEKTRRKMSERRTGRELPSLRKTLIVIAPDGTEYSVTGIQAFCKEHHLAQSSLMQVARGVQRQHRGWTARFP